MYPDEEARKRADIMYIVWTRNQKQYSTELLAAKLAARHRPGLPIKAIHYEDGAYNRCYRITFKEGSDAIVRLPLLGRVALRREKVASEISVREYIAQNTQIPVPAIRGSGVCAAGPYMMTDFVEGNLLSDYLQAPLQDRTQAAILDPTIHISTLKCAYREMARMVLALSRCRFSHIGSLATSDETNTQQKEKTLQTPQVIVGLPSASNL